MQALHTHSHGSERDTPPDLGVITGPLIVALLEAFFSVVSLN